MWCVNTNMSTVATYVRTRDKELKIMMIIVIVLDVYLCWCCSACFCFLHCYQYVHHHHCCIVTAKATLAPTCVTDSLFTFIGLSFVAFPSADMCFVNWQQCQQCISLTLCRIHVACLLRLLLCIYELACWHLLLMNAVCSQHCQVLAAFCWSSHYRVIWLLIPVVLMNGNPFPLTATYTVVDSSITSSLICQSSRQFV